MIIHNLKKGERLIVETGVKFIQTKLTKISILGLYFKFGLYSIPFYSGFSFDTPNTHRQFTSLASPNIEIFVNLVCINLTPVYSEHESWSKGGLA
jgi:hypothetical protein